MMRVRRTVLETVMPSGEDVVFCGRWESRYGDRPVREVFSGEYLFE